MPIPTSRGSHAAGHAPAAPLSAERIQQQCGLEHVRWEIVPTTASTNSDLMQRARERAMDGPVARVADEQTAGRGRLGRTWEGAPGASIFLSVAVPWRREAASSAAVTLACGVAVAQALSREGIEVALKWPNDILLDGRKLAGILTEVAEDPAGERTLVAGLGLNLDLGDEVRGRIDVPVADLAQCRDPALLRAQRERWIVCLAEAMLESVQRFESHGFRVFRAAFDSVFAYRDAPVQVLAALAGAGAANDNVLHQGIARGVDGDGRLLLETDGRVIAVTSGEIRLRPRDGAG
jgi:BirA family biotin operon repressor/biotin-[acetyl-CoA-carboxylase] ligase